ncbi:hypothetical protein WSK_1839 [Novosphingobium sp. Rr 2-17]|nr:hypothetical protein WSK_1839 [Novosphingobium sp. Rr 2-17]
MGEGANGLKDRCNRRKESIAGGGGAHRPDKA